MSIDKATLSKGIGKLQYMTNTTLCRMKWNVAASDMTVSWHLLLYCAFLHGSVRWKIRKGSPPCLSKKVVCLWHVVEHSFALPQDSVFFCHHICLARWRLWFLHLCSCWLPRLATQPPRLWTIELEAQPKWQWVLFGQNTYAYCSTYYQRFHICSNYD